MGDDLAKGTTYSTGGVGGQGVITSANLNAHVDDATIKPSFISAKTERTTLELTDEILVQAGGSLYRAQRSSFYPTGGVLQTIAAAPYVANAALGNIPLDDTIPQIGEGTEILTLNITPQFTASRIRLIFNGFGGVTAAGSVIAALFRVGAADALKATVSNMAAAAFDELNIDWIDVPGVTTAQTYTIRAGAGGAVVSRMNGSSTARFFGGKAACTLIAQEIR